MVYAIIIFVLQQETILLTRSIVKTPNGIRE